MRPLVTATDGYPAIPGGGVVTEFAAPRGHNAVNPDGIWPVYAQATVGAPGVEPTLPLTLPSSTTAISIQPAAALRGTMYQRLYQWPVVGPVNLAGTSPGSVAPPQDPVGDPWKLPSLIPATPPQDSLGVVVGRHPTAQLPQTLAGIMRTQWASRPTLPWTVLPPLFQREGDTTTYVLSGVTRDSAGATLASCRVIVFQTGWLALGHRPIIGETVSDGSGNWSLTVPRAGGYMVWTYKDGSPDVAGTSRIDVATASVLTTWLTNPTSAPPAGGAATYSRGRVVNA